MKQLYSRNGILLPLSEAQIPADRIETMYGFGVYETLKVRSGILYFLPEHVERLLYSARCINLIHVFSGDNMQRWIQEFVEEMDEDSLNLKMLLTGGKRAEEAVLYLFALPPFFPKRTWYKDGVSVQSVAYERWMPHAKTLNMLPSYYYYTRAHALGHYDVLFYDRNGNIREGSRTNFYALRGNTIISPPREDILEGVTLMSLRRALAGTRYALVYERIAYDAVTSYDGCFLSSTSSKIIPISRIDETKLSIPEELFDVMRIYNAALSRSGGIMERMSSESTVS